jgi:hypothetical protein
MRGALSPTLAQRFADRCAAARWPALGIHAALQHEGVRDKLTALVFKHKRCNLPATYASGIGLQAKTLSR